MILLTKHYSVNQIKEYVVSCVFRTHGICDKCMRNCVRKCDGTNLLRDQGVDGSILWKRMRNKVFKFGCDSSGSGQDPVMGSC